MPGKRAISRRQLRGHSAIAQFGPESLVYRWVSPLSTLSFRPDPTRTSELARETAGAKRRISDECGYYPELAEADRHRKATKVMCSVPGVGVITAAAFRLELPEPQRFDHEGQVARMAGLAPQVRQSGETRREGCLLKSGNARLRTILVEAAWRWIAYDETAARRYHQLVANTGSSKKAVVAMARRLGALLWRLSVHGELYQAVA